MQTARLPLRLCENIDKRIRQFIWGGSENKRACSLVRWSKVTHPNKKGELGIRSTRSMNRAFMAKLGWRIMKEDNSLWANIFVNKYMGGERDVDKIRKREGASNAWKGIVEGAHTLRHGWKKFPRNEINTIFWLDSWLTDEPLLHHKRYFSGKNKKKSGRLLESRYGMGLGKL